MHIWLQFVVDSYLKAIGGKDKAQTVKTVWMTADVKIEGMPFAPKGEMKYMTPNKTSLEMSIEGMGVVMKQKFDGETGYAEQQGAKQELTAEQIAEQKAEYTIFPELHFDAANLSLESVTSIDGNDVYKVKVSQDGNDSFRYYDTTTGLLTRVESTVEAQGQSFTSTIDYGNYSPVDGLQFPYSQALKTGPQVLNFNITNVKVNDGVTEADFK